MFLRSLRLAAARNLFEVGLAVSVLTTASTAGAVPPPPPPPEVLARIQADCRTAPPEVLALAMTPAPAPRAAAELNIGWGLKLEPPEGSHIGRVIGIARLSYGDIVAATDGGYWVVAPMRPNGGLDVKSAPVAVPIRDLPGTALQMARWPGAGGPLMTGSYVSLIATGQSRLLNYQVGGCFPGARPEPGLELPAGVRLLRMEPTGDGKPRLILEQVDRTVVFGEAAGATPGPFVVTTAAGALERTARTSAGIALARGCDELTFHAEADGVVVRTSCTDEYLRSLATLAAKPQKQHRQPAPTVGLRTVGRIEAPIVAVSNSSTSFAANGGLPADGAPGLPCFFVLAAQAKADAPIFLYGAQPYCAYYPRGPGGAPFPPPPPP